MIFKKKIFDVIIIGGGAAGISAAVWCDELGLTTLLIEKEKEYGGQLLRVYNPIENHLGINAENGRDLRDVFIRQVRDRKFSRLLSAEAAKIDFPKKTVVLSNGEKLFWKSLIAATGVRRRKLNVEGEDLLTGKGILDSGKNEQQTVKNKSVAVIGGGDAALENSLILAETAGKVFLIHRRGEFRGRAEFVEKVRQNSKIEVFFETAVEKLNGHKKLASIEIKNLSNGRTHNLKVENILVRIGVEPNTELFKKKLKFDKNGYIKVNQFCETNIEHVYAVGDVANPVSPTVSTAAGTGATAAKMIRHRADSNL